MHTTTQLTNSLKISEVAKQLEISVGRLRNWCDKGLVKVRIENNAKVIDSSELEKINRIVSILDAENKKTSLQEVKEILEQEGFNQPTSALPKEAVKPVTLVTSETPDNSPITAAVSPNVNLTKNRKNKKVKKRLRVQNRINSRRGRRNKGKK